MKKFSSALRRENATGADKRSGRKLKRTRIELTRNEAFGYGV
jgi:hypothetical protein